MTNNVKKYTAQILHECSACRMQMPVLVTSDEHMPNVPELPPYWTRVRIAKADANGCIEEYTDEYCQHHQPIIDV